MGAGEASHEGPCDPLMLRTESFPEEIGNWSDVAGPEASTVKRFGSLKTVETFFSGRMLGIS